MSNYTEKKPGISEFAASCAPECECGCTPGNDCFDGDNMYQDEWGFLNDWDSWTDEEKALIFVPHIQYVNHSSVSKNDMGDAVSLEMAKRMLKYHTFPIDISFNLTSNSQIITQVKYESIYHCIPSGHPMMPKITAWGVSHYFIKGC